MKTLGSPMFAALRASLAAGPIFVLSCAVAQAFSLLPEPVPIDASVVMWIIMAFVPSAMVGFVISFVPNAIGTYVLSSAGETSETAREPIVWIGVGGILGLFFAIIFGAFEGSIPVTLALIATSAASAGLCRARTQWED